MHGINVKIIEETGRPYGAKSIIRISCYKQGAPLELMIDTCILTGLDEQSFSRFFIEKEVGRLWERKHVRL